MGSPRGRGRRLIIDGHDTAQWCVYPSGFVLRSSPFAELKALDRVRAPADDTAATLLVRKAHSTQGSCGIARLCPGLIHVLGAALGESHCLQQACRANELFERTGLLQAVTGRTGGLF